MSCSWSVRVGVHCFGLFRCEYLICWYLGHLHIYFLCDIGLDFNYVNYIQVFYLYNFLYRCIWLCDTHVYVSISDMLCDENVGVFVYRTCWWIRICIIKLTWATQTEAVENSINSESNFSLQMNMHMHILVYFLKKIHVGSSLNSGLKLSNPKMPSQASLYMYYIISFIRITQPHQFCNIVCHIFGTDLKSLF